MMCDRTSHRNVEDEVKLLVKGLPIPRVWRGSGCPEAPAIHQQQQQLVVLQPINLGRCVHSIHL